MKNTLVVFEPKNKDLFSNKRRFLIGSFNVAAYIGQKNALVVAERVKTCRMDKLTIKFRKYGKIEIYFK